MYVEVRSSLEVPPSHPACARLWSPAGPSGGPGSKQAGKRPVSLPGLAKGPAGLFSLTVWGTGNVAADTEGLPAGQGVADGGEGVVGRTQ